MAPDQEKAAEAAVKIQALARGNAARKRVGQMTMPDLATTASQDFDQPQDTGMSDTEAWWAMAKAADGNSKAMPIKMQGANSGGLNANVSSIWQNQTDPAQIRIVTDNSLSYYEADRKGITIVCRDTTPNTYFGTKKNETELNWDRLQISRKKDGPFAFEPVSASQSDTLALQDNTLQLANDDQQLANDDQGAAALKIQSLYRGRQDRKEAIRIRQERLNNAAEQITDAVVAPGAVPADTGGAPITAPVAAGTGGTGDEWTDPAKKRFLLTPAESAAIKVQINDSHVVGKGNGWDSDAIATIHQSIKNGNNYFIKINNGPLFNAFIAQNKMYNSAPFRTLTVNDSDPFSEKLALSMLKSQRAVQVYPPLSTPVSA